MSAFSDYIDKKFTQLSKTKRFRQFMSDSPTQEEKTQGVLGFVIINDIPAVSGSNLGASQKMGAMTAAFYMNENGTTTNTLTEIASISHISRRTVVSGAKKIPNIPKLSDLKVTIENDRVTLTPIKK